MNTPTFVPNMPRAEMLANFAKDCAIQKGLRLCTRECYHCPSCVANYGLSQGDAIMLQHTADLAFERANPPVVPKPKKDHAILAAVIIATAIITAAFIFVYLGPGPVVPKTTPNDNPHTVMDLKAVWSWEWTQTVTDKWQWQTDSGVVINKGINCVDYAYEFFELCKTKGIHDIEIWRVKGGPFTDHLLVGLHSGRILFDPQNGHDESDTVIPWRARVK